jgi:S-layer homology domain
MNVLRIFSSAIVIVLLAAILPVSGFASAAGKSVELYYAEDTWDHWAYTEIDDFMSADIIDGSVQYDEDGFPIVKVNPEAQITRAQFTKMIVNALGLSLNGQAAVFTDVKSSDWFYSYVQIANSHGIVTGRNGRFDPYEKINREQMAVMIHRAFKRSINFKSTSNTFTDVPSDYWAYTEINQSAASGIIKGYGTSFKPRNYATRAQGIVMIYRALRQETQNAPSGQMLIGDVTDHFTKERQASKDSDWKSLKVLFNENFTGYQKAVALETLSFIEEMIEMGDTVTIVPDSSPFSVSVVQANDRYAVVNITNLKYVETYYTSETDHYTTTTDYSGKYSLKKDQDGQWKIYNFIFE